MISTLCCISLALPVRAETLPTASALDKPLTVDFILNKPCSLLRFVNTVSGLPHTTEWVKTWYQQQCGRDPNRVRLDQENKELLPQYARVLNSQYSFTDDSGKELDLGECLIQMAAHCTTLSDFLLQAHKVLKEEDFQVVKNVLERIEPFYDKIVWKPRLEELEKQRDECQANAQTCNFSQRLTTVKKFMNAPWSPERPFLVVLIPLPIDHKHTSGTTAGDVQIVEVRPKEKINSVVDVVFHEDCHALWFSKPKIEQGIGRDERFVLSDHRMLPLVYVYEGMVTAIAQGWFAQRAYGQAKKVWYRDDGINRYAHAALPLYAKYLDAGRTIDEDFYRQATDIYYDQLPDELKSVKLTGGFWLGFDKVADNAKLKETVEKSLPRLRELIFSNPLDHLRTAQSLKEARVEHGAVMIRLADLGMLDGLGLSSAQLDILQNSDSTKPIALQVNGKQVLFCIADTPDQQESLLFAALRQSKWPESRQ